MTRLVAIHLIYLLFSPSAVGVSAASSVDPAGSAATTASTPPSPAVVLPPAGDLATVPLFSLASGPAVTYTSSTTAASVVPPSDWLALLAQQLPLTSSPSSSVAKAAPLMLSPALPPIPGKVVDKIHRGENPDLKEMLADNIALAKRLQESGTGPFGTMIMSSRYREIADPITWVFCFLNFVAVKVEDEKTRELIAYAQIILDMARRHGGTGWLAYDAHFRAQFFAGGIYKWNEVNPSLLASAVFGNTRLGEGAKSCPRCMAADHTLAECAIAAMEESRPQSMSQPGPSRHTGSRHPSTPYPLPNRPDEPCRRFNKGLHCSAKSCRYEHTCNSCFRGPHPATECRQKGKRTEDSTHPHPKSST